MPFNYGVTEIEKSLPSARNVVRIRSRHLSPFEPQPPSLLLVDMPPIRVFRFRSISGHASAGFRTFQVRSALLFFQIEQVVGPDRLMRQTPYGRDDRGDAAACRFHPSHSDPQEVLPAIPRFACEVRRFDPAAFQVLLESCRHVQYSASYADEG